MARPLPPVINDNRFEKVKSWRTYQCDSCGHWVYFSSKTWGTGYRADGEFKGSYRDHSWAESLPPHLMKDAWELGLIDCMWLCSEYCGAAVTGQKDRHLKTRKRKCDE